MPVNVRGRVLGVAATRTVTTRYGDRDLAEVGLLLEDGGKTSVTLWGDWAATADYLGHGMELLVTAAETSSSTANSSTRRPASRSSWWSRRSWSM